jgi:hypothetical protein
MSANLVFVLIFNFLPIYPINLYAHTSLFSLYMSNILLIYLFLGNASLFHSHPGYHASITREIQFLLCQAHRATVSASFIDLVWLKATALTSTTAASSYAPINRDLSRVTRPKEERTHVIDARVGYRCIARALAATSSTRGPHGVLPRR